MEQRAIERRFLSPHEAAAYLGVSESAILRWIREGRMSASRIGRCIRIDLQVLDEIGSSGLPPSHDKEANRANDPKSNPNRKKRKRETRLAR